MRKLREVLRLRFELKLGYQQIGRTCAIAVNTVHKYLKRAEAAGVSWPLPEDWDEARVEAAVFPPAAPQASELKPVRTPTDFAAIHAQLLSHTHVTLQLCGRNTGWPNRTAIAIRAFASCTSAGARSWTWCCGRSTRRARRCSWIGRARRFRCTTGARASPGRRPYSQPHSAQATTAGPRPRAIRRCSRGCALTCMRLNTSAASRRWPCTILWPGTKSYFCCRRRYVASPAAEPPWSGRMSCFGEHNPHRDSSHVIRS